MAFAPTNKTFFATGLPRGTDHRAGADRAGGGAAYTGKFGRSGRLCRYGRFGRHGRWFASNQIRNVASLAGNICTASPISDMNPVLIALGASVCLASAAGGNRVVPLRKFFLGYRKVDIKPEEVLVEIIIPRTSASEYVCAYKQARRRDDDISIVNACFRVQFDDEDPLAIVAMHNVSPICRFGAW